MARLPRRSVAGCLLFCMLAGCSPTYVLRGGYEELRILWRRQPIERLLAKELDADTRAKLQLVLELRRFAHDRLGLAVRGSYSSVARVDGRQVVHLVTAARHDRLEPYTWWFPVVGRVPYRGYFDRDEAVEMAAELERRGYDTYVRPSVAFSTLGWFDDPLLSNLLRYDEVSLAEIVVHELLHNTVYLPGQTAFNESFANIVGCRGAEMFFRERTEWARAERAEALCADMMTFSRFLGQWVTRWNDSYARGIDEAERHDSFRAAQAEFAREPWHTKLYDEFGKVDLNNAIIVHHWLYAQRLDLLDAAFVANDHDLARTIGWVAAAARATDDPFAALAEKLAVRSVVRGTDLVP